MARNLLASYCRAFHREPELQPQFEAALERPHALYSLPSELERRTGTRDFVWSRTVEDQLTRFQELRRARFEFVARNL